MSVLKPEFMARLRDLVYAARRLNSPPGHEATAELIALEVELGVMAEELGDAIDEMMARRLQRYNAAPIVADIHGLTGRWGKRCSN